MNTSINPARLAKLMVISLLSITLLPLFALAIYVKFPLADAIFWHVKNGSTVSVEGHSFHVPLQFQVERFAGGFDLTNHNGVYGGLSSVSITPGGKLLDSTEIAKRQSSLLSYLNQHGAIASPELLRGGKLKLMCLRSSVSESEEALICQAVDSDLAITTMAVGKANISEARSIIGTSD